MDSDRRPTSEHTEKRPRRASNSPRSSHNHNHISNMKRHNRHSPSRNHYRPNHHRPNYRNAPNHLPPRANDRERDHRAAGGPPRHSDYPSRGYDDRYRGPPHHSHPPPPPHPPHRDAERNRPHQHNNYKPRYNEGERRYNDGDRRYNNQSQPQPPRDATRTSRNYPPHQGNPPAERRFSYPPLPREAPREGPRENRDLPPYSHPERQRFHERNPPRARFHERDDRYRGPHPQMRRSMPNDRHRGPPPDAHRLPAEDRHRGYGRDENRRINHRPRTDIHPQAVLALENANRFVRDTDEKLTVMLSGLEFSDNRDAVIDRVKRSLYDAKAGLRVRVVYPVGRRCGHCFVVFEDPESKSAALRMGMFPVGIRNAHFHPLEQPYLVAFRENPDLNVSELDTFFSIGGLQDVSAKYGQVQTDIIYEVPSFQSIVRVLSIDGFTYGSRPHVAVRCFTPGQPRPSGFRKKFEGEGRRVPVKREWHVKFKHVPESVPMREFHSFLENHNVRGVKVERTGPSEVTVFGESFDNEWLFDTTYHLRYHDFSTQTFDSASAHDGDVGVRKRAHSEPAGGAPPPKKIRSETYISPLTPPSPPRKIKNEDVENSLKAVGERLERMRSAITSQKAHRPKENMAQFDKRIKSLASSTHLEKPVKKEPEKAREKDEDTGVVRVWSGPIRMGKKGQYGNADASVLWRETQQDKKVKELVNLFPESLEISHRVDPLEPGFSHMLNSKATVFLVRGNQEEGETNLSLPQDIHPQPTSRSIVLGIAKYLKENNKAGLIRYQRENREGKLAALVVPPTEAMIDRLNIPWRFNELIMHDTLFVVIGSKARSATVRNQQQRRR